MPLNSSGPISIGGTTVGQSINIELGRTATASSNLNETNLRNLAVKSSGAISLSDFRGKAAVNVSSIDVTNDPGGQTGTLVATYQLNSNGIAYYTGGVNFDTLFAISNEWIATSTLTGLASLYEGRMDTLTGTGGTVGGSAFGTWLNLGTTRSWTVTVTAPNTAFRQGVVRIRNAATGQELVNTTINFTII